MTSSTNITTKLTQEELVVCVAVALGAIVIQTRHLDLVAATHHTREDAGLFAHRAQPQVVETHRLTKHVDRVNKSAIQLLTAAHLIIYEVEIIGRQSVQHGLLHAADLSRSQHGSAVQLDLRGLHNRICQSTCQISQTNRNNESHATHCFRSDALSPLRLSHSVNSRRL